MVKREHFVGVKLTQKEYEYIVKMAENDTGTCWKSGRKNLSAYVRKCVLQSSGFENETKLRKELDSLTFQIRKIGVNINQAVKKINANNFYDVQTTEMLHDGLEQVNEKMQDLLEELRKINGSNKIDEH